MERNDSPTGQLVPMSLPESFLLFGIPTIMFLAATYGAIPFLTMHFDVLPVIAWFIAGGVFVFIPLFVVAVSAAGMESIRTHSGNIAARLRLFPMNTGDWLWAAGATVIVFAFMCAISYALDALHGTVMPGEFSPDPPFLDFHGIGEEQGWILLAWLPFFFFNIVGEELLWRGYILPRQELRHGNQSWAVNASLWAMFHLCFGWRLIVMLSPILFILPYVVQRRGNTTVGIVIHGIVNGSGFLATALGLL